jgi:hypothetical protein
MGMRGRTDDACHEFSFVLNLKNDVQMMVDDVIRSLLKERIFNSVVLKWQRELDRL